MPGFSLSSKQKLETCHVRLQEVFNLIVQIFDCKVLEGHRNEEDQNRAFDQGVSKLRWPDGKHNSLPSRAVDVAPYPIDWKDTKRFYYFAGLVKGVAASRGIKIRWGGDWDSDNDFKDQNFNDLVHFELVE